MSGAQAGEAALRMLPRSAQPGGGARDRAKDDQEGRRHAPRSHAGEGHPRTTRAGERLGFVLYTILYVCVCVRVFMVHSSHSTITRESNAREGQPRAARAGEIVYL